MSRAENSNSTLGLCGLAVFGAAMLCVAGCGGPYDSKVAGKVTLDGTAVPAGTVAFLPVSSGPAAYGRVDSSGNYTIQTGREVGLPSGDYQVAVTANEPSQVTKTANGGPPPPGKAITPAWYGNKDSSGLEIHGKEGFEHDRFGIEVAAAGRMEAAAGTEDLASRSIELATAMIEKWHDGIGSTSRTQLACAYSSALSV